MTPNGRTRSGRFLTDELVERLHAEMDAGISPDQLRPRAVPIADVLQLFMDGMEPHVWVPGMGGICSRCSLAGRLINDDYYSLAVIGFKDDPIHLKEE